MSRLITAKPVWCINCTRFRGLDCRKCVDTSRQFITAEAQKMISAKHKKKKAVAT